MDKRTDTVHELLVINRICRACLKDNVDIKILNERRLIEEFYLITSAKYQNGVACALCVYCYAVLRKSMCFKDMCRKSNSILSGYREMRSLYDEMKTFATYLQTTRSRLSAPILEPTALPRMTIAEYSDDLPSTAYSLHGDSPMLELRNCKSVLVRHVKEESEEGRGAEGNVIMVVDEDSWFPDGDFREGDSVKSEGEVGKVDINLVPKSEMLEHCSDKGQVQLGVELGVECEGTRRGGRSHDRTNGYNLDGRSSLDSKDNPADLTLVITDRCTKSTKRKHFQENFDRPTHENVTATPLDVRQQTDGVKAKKRRGEKKTLKKKKKRKTLKEPKDGKTLKRARKKKSSTRVKDKKAAKEKRALPEGFSSKMVQETAFYNVVKVSKVEILERMRERALSEVYVNAPFKCEKCVKGFNFQDVLQNHMALHVQDGTRVECDICQQYIAAGGAMRAHMKFHTTNYRCKLCGVVRSSRHNLMSHYEMEHDTAPRIYNCEHCSRSMTKRTMFVKHMRTHFPSSRIACEKCGKLFKTIETLRAHTLRHAEVKPFVCKICSKSFLYLSMLRKHSSVHERSARFTCEPCRAPFSSAHSLRLHLRRSLKHIDVDTMRCRKCSAQHADADALLAHQSRCRPPSPGAACACAACGAPFASERRRARHERVVHGAGADGEGREARFVCEVCGQRCYSNSTLVKHIRRHTGERPHHCPHCDKSFIVKYHLREHLNHHTGERPYVCGVCGKGFHRKSDVTRHAAVHTGRRAYACALCDKAFTQAASRRAHVAAVHGGAPRARRAVAKGSAAAAPATTVPVYSGGNNEVF